MPVQSYARANTNASPLQVKSLRHYFCKTRGIFTYIADGENAKDGYRVNLGCVEGSTRWRSTSRSSTAGRCRW